MKDDALRARLRQALDREFAHLEPSPAQREKICQNALGGNSMKIRPRPSFGLILAIVLTLMAVTATAAVLLSAQQVVEETAVPMALNNDTPVRVVESYSPDQVAALIKAANENGITLDETTGIMQALKKGEGYYESEAIMEICRAAFGGLFGEWTIEEQYWFTDVMVRLNYADENWYCLPGPEDMTSDQARQLAVELVKRQYPTAAEIEDERYYIRYESFVMDYDEDGQPMGPIWRFEFHALDLTHPEYTVSFDRQGNLLFSDESAAFADGPFTMSGLISQIHSATRSRHWLQSDWDQNAWHLFREYLPQSDGDNGWSMERDAYLMTEYPLPDENDIPKEQAVDIVRQSLDGRELEVETAILMAYQGQRFWKVTFMEIQNGRRANRFSWEIDSRTGEILAQNVWGSGTGWSGYVPQTVYDLLHEGMLTEAEAKALAADGLRKALQDDAVPFDDPACFTCNVSYLERRQMWRVEFRTRDLRFGSCAAEITEPDHQVSITKLSAPQADGDTLYQRYQEVYGSLIYAGQDVLIRFSSDLAALSPAGWKGKLLQKTVFPPLSEAKISLSDAVDIAARVNESTVHEEMGSVLLGTDGNPVWKFMLDGEENCWVYEVDAVTGQILDVEAFKPDNYDFDDPLKRLTLRRDFMPAYIAEFGIERAAAVEVTKAFADMTYDEPMLPLLEDPDGDGIVHYETVVDGLTVTFRADAPGCDSYRVVFGEDFLPQTVEIVEP